MKDAQRADAAKRTGKPPGKGKKPAGGAYKAAAEKVPPYDIVDKELVVEGIWADPPRFGEKIILTGADEAGVRRVPACQEGRLLSVRVEVEVGVATRFSWRALVSDTCTHAITPRTLADAGAVQHSDITKDIYSVPITVPIPFLKKEGEPQTTLYLIMSAVGYDNEPYKFIVKARFAVPKQTTQVIHF